MAEVTGLLGYKIFMKLSKRLQTIADLVKKDFVVADIGTDHGYLVADLVKNNIIKKAIASDINKGPVENCKDTINSENLAEFIDIRLGGGFAPYKVKDADIGIIAGMGGQLIRDIIIDDIDIARNFEYLILQPMTGQDVLRKYLIENNFEILDEVIVNEQNRFYEVIVVKNSDKRTIVSNDIKIENEDIFLEIGFRVDLEKSNYIGFLDKKISKYETIQNNIIKNEKLNEESKIKVDNIKRKLSDIKEVKECILILVK